MAIESGVYTSAALNDIYGGKQLTRCFEYHLMNAIAVLSLTLEAALGPELPQDLRSQAEAFIKALHDDDEEILFCTKILQAITRLLLNLNYQSVIKDFQSS